MVMVAMVAVVWRRQPWHRASEHAYAEIETNFMLFNGAVLRELQPHTKQIFATGFESDTPVYWIYGWSISACVSVGDQWEWEKSSGKKSWPKIMDIECRIQFFCLLLHYFCLFSLSFRFQVPVLFLLFCNFDGREIRWKTECLAIGIAR